MMTYDQAKTLRAAYDKAARELTRSTKADLQKIRARALEAEGVICVSGGPLSKDELVRDILDRLYSLDNLNEAIHVLHHAPSSRWSGCDHCQSRPLTATVNTSQLHPGDVVRSHGMRIRVDEVQAYRPDGADPGELAWLCRGTVLNVLDVIEHNEVPRSFLQSFGYTEGRGFTALREDVWTMQGNEATGWTVELPRPAAEVTP